MARKAAHPDKQLFDYLSGTLDAPSAQEVEKHLATCFDCARAAELVRALKSTPRGGGSATLESDKEHPDAGQLAALFYGKAVGATPADTAAHVAKCQSCAMEISEYARAEAAASVYKPGHQVRGAVPPAAWEMIREWEDSSFAKLKSESEMIGHELLAKLFGLLSERKDWRGEARRRTADSSARKSQLEGVPVVVVDRSGELRSVEIFERVTDATGADVLRLAEQSERFDDKTVHVLHEIDGRQRVASYRIRTGSIRLEEASAEETADYFIIED